LLADAGYKDASGTFDPKKFEASEIELMVNNDSSNIPYAEFVQAQWKQNLGATIQIRVMENKDVLQNAGSGGLQRRVPHRLRCGLYGSLHVSSASFMRRAVRMRRVGPIPGTLRCSMKQTEQSIRTSATN
jgi:ABC-type transport system substrate-binding protein